MSFHEKKVYVQNLERPDYKNRAGSRQPRGVRRLPNTMNDGCRAFAAAVQHQRRRRHTTAIAAKARNT